MTSSVNKSKSKSSLVTFFFIAYVFQGVACAQFGIVGQPVQYFLMDGLGLNAAEISSFMSALMIPWIVKPIYGVISDAIPLFGYRRKSYLILAGLTAAIAFLLMSLFCTLGMTIGCLAFAAFGMAVSTALMVGLAVERGRDDGQAREYFRVQEVGYYLTNIIVVILAGYICHAVSPEQALKIASVIAAVCALGLALVTATKLKEDKETESGDLLEKIKIIFSSFADPKIRYILLLTCLWAFTMSYGASLYYHESKTLQFTQSLIGQLSAWTACGTLTGAIFYNRISKGFTNLKQTIVTATIIMVSTLAYIFLINPTSAILLEFFHGIANMFSILTIYGLASEVCQEGAEASTMAVIVAVMNISTSAALFTGGQLFTHVLNSNYTALAAVASIPAALSLVIIYLNHNKAGQ